MGVQEKISKPIAKTIIETTFIVDAYKIDKIPIGLLPYYNEICATNKHNHHCQVVINNAYFFNNKLWIPLKPKDAEEKTLLKGADIATIINLISIDGKKITCKDGRITGGDCIMKMKNAKKYKVTLEFEQ